MRPKRLIKPQDVVGLYTVQHLSCAQIALIAGVCRQQIWKILQSKEVNTSKGKDGATWIKYLCNFCGKPSEMRRARWRNSEKHYCSNECYYASIENPGYHPWRQGQRLARAIVAQYFPLQPEHIPHHKDGDCRNNNLDNLAVYASHSDHLKATHHNNGNIKPIWDGADP